VPEASGEFGEKGEGGGFGYSHADELSSQGFGAVEDYYPVFGGAGDELGVVWVFGFIEVGFFTWAFDEDDELLIEKLCA